MPQKVQKTAVAAKPKKVASKPKKVASKPKKVASKPKKVAIKRQLGGNLELDANAKCEGECSKYLEQLNVYSTFFRKVNSQEMERIAEEQGLEVEVKANGARYWDWTPTSQLKLELFHNLFLMNLATYLIANYGKTPKLNTQTDIKDALLEGNKNAEKYLVFREKMAEFLLSREFRDYAINASSVSLCIRNSGLKTSMAALGLQYMFADADLQEVTHYINGNGSWFSNNLMSAISVIETACQEESYTSKGINVLKKVAGLTGRGIITSAIYSGKGALALAKGISYLTPSNIKSAASASTALLGAAGDIIAKQRA